MSKTIIQEAVTPVGVKRVVIEPASVTAGVVTWLLRFDYDPVDDTGRPFRGTHRTLTMVPSAALQQVIQNLISTHVVAHANQVEGT